MVRTPHVQQNCFGSGQEECEVYSQRQRVSHPSGVCRASNPCKKLRPFPGGSGGPSGITGARDHWCDIGSIVCQLANHASTTRPMLAPCAICLHSSCPTGRPLARGATAISQWQWQVACSADCGPLLSRETPTPVAVSQGLQGSLSLETPGLPHRDRL